MLQNIHKYDKYDINCIIKIKNGFLHGMALFNYFLWKNGTKNNFCRHTKSKIRQAYVHIAAEFI